MSAAPRTGSSLRRHTTAWPRFLATVLGAVIGGGVAWLYLSPAGLSRVTLEFEAEYVWAPTIFTVAWNGAGAGLDWVVSPRLPTTSGELLTLEIMPAGIEDPRPAHQVWLIKAMWPDGQAISLDEFQAEGDWTRPNIDWQAYQDRPIWVSEQRQPSLLRWQGLAPGPLTLIFAMHEYAGQVLIRWNGLEQVIDLYAPQTQFRGVTLATGAPVVWRATLPVTALEDELNLLIDPDPTGNLGAIIKKISLSRAWGQPVAATGEQLLEALAGRGGQPALVPEGLRLIPDNPYKPPYLALTDTFVSQVKPGLIFPPWLENLAVVVGAGAIGFVGMGLAGRRLPPQLLLNGAVVTISLGLSLLLVEGGLRLYLPAPGRYYLQQPYLQRTYDPDPTITPGVNGISRFWTNSQGFQSDEFSPDDDYRLLAIGGSTTMSILLDQTETWPQLLQDKLNAGNENFRVWVGNAGRRGRSSRENLMHVKYLLPQYPDIDAIILLLGINDLGLRLGQGNRYDPNFLASPGGERSTIYRAFDYRVKQDPFEPYYKQTGIWRLFERLWGPAPDAQVVLDTNPDEDARAGLIRAREKRQQAPVEDELPNLTPALAEYRRNINTMIDLAQARQVRVILMTQPSLWRPDLTQAERDLLWFGWGPDDKFFYSVEALAEGLEQYNEQVRQICRERQVECIDLARLLPQDTTIFYDDVHFNENGARQVAEVIADYLRQHPPFNDYGR